MINKTGREEIIAVSPPTKTHLRKPGIRAFADPNECESRSLVVSTGLKRQRPELRLFSESHFEVRVWLGVRQFPKQAIRDFVWERERNFVRAIDERILSFCPDHRRPYADF